MIRLWLGGLLRRHRARLFATAAGVSVAVALIASLGTFLSTSQAAMTDRALRSVAVDWQVELAPGSVSETAATARLVAQSPGVTASARVGFARTSGLAAATASSSQTTGPGVVLGIPETYRTTFPGQIRTLVGADSGVLLAQQTAANLHAAPGDTITIGRDGLPPTLVRVAGIVELPQANSLFQTVGAAPGAQPAAPPDNVLLLPERQWHLLFDPLAVTRPDLVSTQIHLQRSHDLPPDPGGADTAVRGAARNLEAHTAGAALVGDNLGAALAAARGDAAYARILFLFLGLPGAVLAALLTATVTSAGAERRRAEQALLRVRGATSRQLLVLAAAEAVVIGAVGALGGLLAAAMVNTLSYGSPRFGVTATAAVGWPAAATAAGMAVAAATVLLPARRDLRERTVTAGRVRLAALTLPSWARTGTDVLILAGAAALFYATTGSGYQLVLAPEGVPAISVSYWAFAGPALLWVGAALLTWRLADLLLGPGRALIAALLGPVTGALSGTIAAGMSRARRPLVQGIVMLALAIAFAVSTATFNATYRQQAEVDAQLTNGADVTVTAAPSTALRTTAFASVPGVRAAEPMLHRFAYIGADLQDLYGVRPATITGATALQDGYFPQSSAAALMGTLASAPDSILLSAETVHDFQLQPGDPVTLRLVDPTTSQLRPVTFHYAGLVTEFPTAPKDSFLVVNADYLAGQTTGTSAPNVYLIDTGGRDTATVAARLRALVGSDATVSDIATVRADVGSSLTAVDLSGLTRIELAFALVLAVTAGAVVFGLGLADRRRAYALMLALGARRGHLRALVFGDTAVLTIAGTLAGAAIGSVLSMMLVTVLGGVFDPPPEAIAIPWPYLGATAAVTIGALGAVSAGAVRLFTRRPGSISGVDS